MSDSTNAIIAGGLTAALHIGTAIFGDAQRDKAAARQRGQANKAWRAKKKQLYAKFHRDIEDYNANVKYTEQLWNAKFQQGMSDIQFTNQHAADTYYLRQQQLNQQFQQLAFEDQDRVLRHAKSQGVAAAKAQMGATAGRFDVANAAIKGRNEAIQAREVTGMIDSFDMQSAIDNRVNAHKLDNIGRRMAILPQLGRVPEIPTMPEKPEGFMQNNSALWMGIGSGLLKGAIAGLGAAPGETGDLGASGSQATAEATANAAAVTKGSNAGLSNAQSKSFGFSDTSGLGYVPKTRVDSIYQDQWQDIG